MKEAILINNWSIIDLNNDPYLAPECRRVSLRGNVVNHPTQGNNTVITSSIVDVNSIGQVITKSGSVYELGNIDPEYKKLFPNSREKINSFKNGSKT